MGMTLCYKKHCYFSKDNWSLDEERYRLSIVVNKAKQLVVLYLKELI